MLFIAWIVVELRSQQPLVDVRMMRIPTVWWTNIAATLFGFGMYSLMVAVPAFLQTPSSAGYGFDASIAESGFALLPMSVAMLVAGIATGRLTTRFGSKVPLVAGSVISSVGMLFLAVEHGSEWNIYVAMALVGLGIGFAFSAMSNLVVEAVPATQTGVATGMNANVRTIGGSIGSQIVSTVIVAGVAAGAVPHERGYVVAFVVHGRRPRSRRRRRGAWCRAAAARRAARPADLATARAVRGRRAHRSRPPRPAWRSASGGPDMSRSDALRNRQRVLDAAVEAYAHDGPRFGMHDVARRANVGVGTVYRHFADRDQLVDAIASPFFQQTLVIAARGAGGGAARRAVRGVRARVRARRWPTTACRATARGTRPPPSRSGPSCASW